jgi:ankyrin repeat protein
MGAALSGRQALVKLLLDKGAEVDASAGDGYTALSLALDKGHIDLAEFLLANGAEKLPGDVDLSGLLIEAAIKGHARLVKTLWKIGSDINVRDSRYHNTPLVWAAYYNRVAVAEFLLGVGADLHQRNRFGNTALFWAARGGNRKIAEMLISHGAEVNAQDREGKTPLMVAAGAGRLELVKFLVERGADVNARSAFDWSAIMEAYFEGHADVVAYLKSVGASLSGFIKYRGRSPRP